MQTKEELRKRLGKVSHLIIKDAEQKEFEKIVEEYLNSKGSLLELRGSANRDDFRRGLFVKRGVRIPNKSIIFRFVPFMQVTDPGNETNCSYCFAYIHDKRYICGSCKVRKYCSSKCQEKDRGGFHTFECELIQKKQFNIIIIGALKLMYSLSTDFKNLTLCQNLSSHLGLFLGWLLRKKKPDKIHIELFDQMKNSMGLTLMKVIGGDLNMSGVFKCILLTMVNAVAMNNSYDESIGLLFDPVLALINHSCYDRNCSLGWLDGKEVCLDSINNLQSDQELMFSYCPVTVPVEIRQRILQSWFFFQCQCAMCMNSSRNGEKWLPIYCSHCGKENTSTSFNLTEFLTDGSTILIENNGLKCNSCKRGLQAAQTWRSYRKLTYILLGATMEDDKVRNAANCHQLEILQEISTGLNVNCGDSNQLKDLKQVWNESLKNGASWRSWPVQVIANTLLQKYEEEEPENFDVVSLTVMTNFFSSSSEGIRGMGYYNVAVAYDRWIQYQRREASKKEVQICLALVGRAYRSLWEESAAVTSPMKDLLRLAKSRQRSEHYGSIQYLNEKQIQQTIWELNTQCFTNKLGAKIANIETRKMQYIENAGKKNRNFKMMKEKVENKHGIDDRGDIFQLLLI